MRYYLDTEFDETRLKMISIGLVSQDNREFYAVNHSYERVMAGDWLQANVIPQLFNLEVTKKSGIYQGREPAIAREIMSFLGDDEDAQFWGYYPAWDIVMVHNLFGGYQGVLAQGGKVPLNCYDLKQFAKSCGVTSSLNTVVPQFKPEHHALTDARWNKFVHEQLIFQHGKEI